MIRIPVLLVASLLSWTTISSAALQATLVSQTPGTAQLSVPTDSTMVVSVVYKNTGTALWSPTTGNSNYVVLCTTNALGTQLRATNLITNPLSTTTIVAPTSTVYSVNAGNNACNAMHLRWTAVGDDSLTGRATSYDVRYSTSLLTTSNWSTAPRWMSAPNPSQPGMAESTYVTGLTPARTYYFGVRAIDDANNMALISNIASHATAGDTYTFLFSLKTPSSPGLDTLYLGVYNPSSGTIISTSVAKIVLNVHASGPVGPDVEAFAAQFGGNRFSDLLTLDRSAGQLWVALRDSTANRFVPSVSAWSSGFLNTLGAYQLLPLDFTGDSLADVIVWEWGTGSFYGAKNLATNNGFGPFRRLLTGYHPTSDTLAYSILPGSFIPGRRGSLMFIDNRAGSRFVLSFSDTTCSQVSGPEPNGAFISDYFGVPDPSQLWHGSGDIDGDRLSDVLDYKPLEGDVYGLHGTGSSLAFINGPYPYGAMLHEYDQSMDPTYFRPLLGDFDGDGKLDFGTWIPDEAKVFVATGTGSMFNQVNGAGAMGSWLDNMYTVEHDRYRVLVGVESYDAKNDLIIEDRKTGLWSVALATTRAFQTTAGAYAGGAWTPTWGPMNAVMEMPSPLAVPTWRDSSRLFLQPVWPNPCRGAVTIQYGLPTTGAVSLRIYDVAGRLVSIVVDGLLSAGPHLVRWRPTSELNPGVYLLTLQQTGHKPVTQKLTLLR